MVSMELPYLEINYIFIIYKLCLRNITEYIIYQDEICSEELAVEKAVKESCEGQKIVNLWGSTVYHVDDLGFHPKELPHIYEEKTADVKIRPLFAQPKSGQLPYAKEPSPLMEEASKFMPTLKDFGFTKEQIEKPKDKRACYDFVGGEDNAVKRLNEYIMGTKSVGSYAITRNNLIGANYSSKFSPWLACGALSPSKNKECNETGFMPNRGRMIVACYLTMDLKHDWREGAYHFEEKLIDHDVQSNYGGWNFSAGIGPGRVLVFNSIKQSKDHDKHGEYIKMWVPELKNVPIEYIHEPWTMPKDLQKGSKCIIGQDYPHPIDCPKYTNKNQHVKDKAAKKIQIDSEKKLKQTTLKK